MAWQRSAAVALSGFRRLIIRRLACSLLLVFVARCDGRIVSVPDVHGDYERVVEILTAAKLIDPKTLQWIGGAATLVQTGDIADRGDHAKRIYELFFQLAREAPQAGGSVINLLGNHEVMNLQGDQRYVSRGDIAEFGGPEERLKAWGPDGWLGRRVRHFPAAAKAGDVLFVHAGLLPRWLEGDGSLDGLNKDMAAALTSDGQQEPAALLQDDGPVWTRYFAEEPDSLMCPTLREVLARVGAARMVVGHTIQESPEGGTRVRPACEGRLVLADTAVSRVYGGTASFIEYDGAGGAAAVYPGVGRRQELPPVSAVVTAPGGRRRPWRSTGERAGSIDAAGS